MSQNQLLLVELKLSLLTPFSKRQTKKFLISFHQIFHGFLRCKRNSWFVPGTNNADIYNFVVQKGSLSKTSVLKLTWFIAKVLDFFNLRSS